MGQISRQTSITNFPLFLPLPVNSHINSASPTHLRTIPYSSFTCPEEERLIVLKTAAQGDPQNSPRNSPNAHVALLSVIAIHRNPASLSHHAQAIIMKKAVTSILMSTTCRRAPPVLTFAYRSVKSRPDGTVILPQVTASSFVCKTVHFKYIIMSVQAWCHYQQLIAQSLLADTFLWLITFHQAQLYRLLLAVLSTFSNSLILCVADKLGCLAPSNHRPRCHTASRALPVKTDWKCVLISVNEFRHPSY